MLDYRHYGNGILSIKISVLLLLAVSIACYSTAWSADTVIKGNLMWQKADDGVLRTWNDANSHCNSLIFGGYGDWRMPTKDELKSLVVCSNGKPTPLEDYDWSGTLSEEENLRRSTCGGVGWGLYDIPTIDKSFSCSKGTYGNYNNTWTSPLFSCNQKKCAKIIYWGSGMTSYNQADNISASAVRCVRENTNIPPTPPPNPGIDLLLKKSKYNNFISNFQVGDILFFSNCSGNVEDPLDCSPILPFGIGPGYGYYSHAALIYEKNGDQIKLLHARNPTSGVGIDALTYELLLRNYKHVSLLRANNLSDITRRSAALYAYSRWNGTNYDTDLNPFNDRVYCTELVFDAYKVMGNVSLNDNSIYPFGIFTPDSLSQSSHLSYISAYEIK